ncbi:MAG: N-acetylmuramoyl-L-alanine amidase [Clostridia bacterium]|nr:N-acetylmuramoyl-L-alanine amidase [Clostridia bacterium]
MKKTQSPISEQSLFFYKICLLSFIIVFVAVIFFFVGKIFVPVEKLEEAGATPFQIQTVVIDAGHGGKDGGASVGEVYEKNLNLEISHKVAQFLSLYNVNVVMTRSEDSLLAEDSSNNKKRDDLFNRVKIAKQYEDPVFVSIHMNKFPQEKYKGLQVFFSGNNPYSESLALMIQSNVKEYLEDDNDRNVKRAGASIYVLDRLLCPSVLIECGFLSNPDDLNKLQSEEYQNALAFVIANSIIEYINL